MYFCFGLVFILGIESWHYDHQAAQSLVENLGAVAHVEMCHHLFFRSPSLNKNGCSLDCLSIRFYI